MDSARPGLLLGVLIVMVMSVFYEFSLGYLYSIEISLTGVVQCKG